MVSERVLDPLRKFLLPILRLATSWGNPAANLLLYQQAQVHGEEENGGTRGKTLKFQTLNLPQKLLKQSLAQLRATEDAPLPESLSMGSEIDPDIKAANRRPNA